MSQTRKNLNKILIELEEEINKLKEEEIKIEMFDIDINNIKEMKTLHKKEKELLRKQTLDKECKLNALENVYNNIKDKIAKIDEDEIYLQESMKDSKIKVNKKILKQAVYDAMVGDTAIDAINDLKNNDPENRKKKNRLELAYQIKLFGLELLEQHFEEKPIEEMKIVNKKEIIIYKCPICSTEVNKTFNFCKNCGKAIDWTK